MAALTETDSNYIVPDELFTGSSINTLSKLTSALSLSSSSAKGSGTDSFTLLTRIAKDPALAPGTVYKPGPEVSIASFAETVQNGGKLIWKYVEEWNLDVNDEKNLKSKLEELSWLATLIYGVGGFQVGKEFKANFF